jgi:hypothetical protein
MSVAPFSPFAPGKTTSYLDFRIGGRHRGANGQGAPRGRPDHPSLSRRTHDRR